MYASLNSYCLMMNEVLLIEYVEKRLSIFLYDNENLFLTNLILIFK
jgi:hypothetical protein